MGKLWKKFKSKTAETLMLAMCFVVDTFHANAMQFNVGFETCSDAQTLGFWLLLRWCSRSRRLMWL